MKNALVKKISNPVAKIFRKMAIIGANSASVLGTYQPVEPKEMKKFKK